MTSDAPRLPAPPIVGDVALNRGPVPASPPIDEAGRPLDLVTTPPDVPPPPAPTPTLLDLPDPLFPLEFDLDPAALALPPLHTPERWRHLADALVDAAARGEDQAVSSAMSGEAGRIHLQQLGRRDPGERLLAAGSPAARACAARTAALSPALPGHSLADDLDQLAQEAADPAQPAALRAAAWIEHGQRSEQYGADIDRALASYRAALELVPDHPIAVTLVLESMLRGGQREALRPLLEQHIASLDLPRLRAVRQLDLAGLLPDPDDRRRQLELAVASDPTSVTALHRLISALRGAAGDSHPELPGLYRRLAGLAPDLVSAAAALQLAVLAVGDDEIPRELLADIRTWLSAHGNDPTAHGLLDALVSNFNTRDPRGTRELGIPGLRSIDVLVRLTAFKDDPREQASLREQIARLRREASPLA